MYKLALVILFSILISSCIPSGGGTVTPTCNYTLTDVNIQHKCLNQSYNIIDEVSTKTYTVDVDNDGAIDLTFTSNTNGFVAVGNPTPSSKYNLNITAASNVFLRTNYYSVTELQPVAKLDSIGPNYIDAWNTTFPQPYINDTSLSILEYKVLTNPTKITYSNYLLYASQDKNNTTGYIGFYLQKASGKHYGWIQVNIQSSLITTCNITSCTTHQALAKKVSIIDVAFCKIPNKTIVAGL